MSLIDQAVQAGLLRRDLQDGTVYSPHSVELDTTFNPTWTLAPTTPTPPMHGPTFTLTQQMEEFLAKQQEKQPVTDAKPQGVKFDADKLPLHLLSTEAMNQTAAVLKFGAKKYAANNWRAGFDWSRPLSAAMRHITAFNDGEDCDPESGLSHLAHAACCIMFLLEFQKTHPELDDRYKPNLPKAS